MKKSWLIFTGVALAVGVGLYVATDRVGGNGQSEPLALGLRASSSEKLESEKTNAATAGNVPVESVATAAPQSQVPQPTAVSQSGKLRDYHGILSIDDLNLLEGAQKTAPSLGAGERAIDIFLISQFGASGRTEAHYLWRIDNDHIVKGEPVALQNDELHLQVDGKARLTTSGDVMLELTAKSGGSYRSSSQVDRVQPVVHPLSGYRHIAGPIENGVPRVLLQFEYQESTTGPAGSSSDKVRYLVVATARQKRA